MEKLLDKITGCMLGGAVGDALGYPVEFMSYQEIINTYGEKGIRRFALDSRGLAVISDDTQMSLFTANGILMGFTRGCMRGIGGNPDDYVKYAYRDWYYTQTKSAEFGENCCSWIRDIPELNIRRAPGNTCLLAIANPNKKNDSKGCGGIMRVAPMALFCASLNAQGKIPSDIKIEEYACQSGRNVAKVTHHHPLGYIPAAFLNLLIYRLACEEEDPSLDSFKSHLSHTMTVMTDIYGSEHTDDCAYLKQLVDKAIQLAGEGNIDEEKAIRQLGEGWVAEETLAIALYCVMKHIDSFENAVCASVNHSGDSDSTGAVCGNIMGVMYGCEAIPDFFKDNIELRELIESMSHDLYTGCIISEYDPKDTPEKLQWYLRYCEMEAVGLKLHPWYRAEFETGGIKAAMSVQELMQFGYDGDYVFFWGHHSKEGEITKACFSQWYPCSFTINGLTYNCAEQYMMAEKARIMGDDETLDLIMKAGDPKEIKELGRKINNFDEQRWDRYKYSVVLNGNYYKFSQNEELLSFLLSTSDAVLVEASPYDTVWGIGYAEDAPESKDPAQWRGENLLGFALMQIRERFSE